MGVLAESTTALYDKHKSYNRASKKYSPSLLVWYGNSARSKRTVSWCRQSLENLHASLDDEIVGFFVLFLAVSYLFTHQVAMAAVVLLVRMDAHVGSELAYIFDGGAFLLLSAGIQTADSYMALIRLELAFVLWFLRACVWCRDYLCASCLGNLCMQCLYYVGRSGEDKINIQQSPLLLPCPGDFPG